MPTNTCIYAINYPDIMKLMKKIPNPHDHYFRTVMADHRVAKEFFENHLPANILKITDLNSLRLEKSSFIDEHLQASLADMLYSVNLNNHSGYFYVLVEHQRKPDKLMPYRLLCYMLRITDYHLKKKDHHNILPVIMPIVFYNGKQPYPYSTDLFTLFGNQESLAREILLKPFVLVDVAQIPDERLKQMRWAGIMEFAQKHIFARDFMAFLKELLPLLKQLEMAGAQEYLTSTLTYLFQSDIENPVKIAKLISDEISSGAGDKIMTLAERLERAGFEKGLAEGRTLAERLEQAGFEKGQAEAQRQIAKQMLEQKADPAFVAKVTELSLKEVQKLALIM